MYFALLYGDACYTEIILKENNWLKLFFVCIDGHSCAGRGDQKERVKGAPELEALCGKQVRKAGA